MRKQPSLPGNGIIAATKRDRSQSLLPGLPAGLELYARTPDFTDLTIPAELTDGHALGEGVWGVLRVLDGTLLYIAENQPLPLSLGAGDAVAIEPELGHRLQPSGHARFFIEFHSPSDRIRAKIQTGSC